MFKDFFNRKKKIESVKEENQPVENKVETFEKEIETTANEAEIVESKFEIDKIDWLINDSILTFLPRELFMHYWDGVTIKDMQDAAWQNQGIYFWKEQETFEKKSLPPHFQDLNSKLFVFNKVPDYISLASGLAMPWFGMPGGGEKLFFRYEGNPITLEEAERLGAIKYVKITDLNFDNLSILNDRDNYQFLVDPNEVTFQNQIFYLNEKEISLAALYQKNKLKIISRW